MSQWQKCPKCGVEDDDPDAKPGLCVNCENVALQNQLAGVLSVVDAFRKASTLPFLHAVSQQEIDDAYAKAEEALDAYDDGKFPESKFESHEQLMKRISADLANDAAASALNHTRDIGVDDNVVRHRLMGYAEELAKATGFDGSGTLRAYLNSGGKRFYPEEWDKER